jgi:hypothetical protein
MERIRQARHLRHLVSIRSHIGNKQSIGVLVVLPVFNLNNRKEVAWN